MTVLSMVHSHFWRKNIFIFDQLLTKTWWTVIAIRCKPMASFVKLFMLSCKNNKESGFIVIYVGWFFSALQTSAPVICMYFIEVVLQAGCGKLNWNLYFHSSSAQWLDLLFCSSDKVCESHPRLVDLPWPMHQQCSKTFSCGGSQVWGVGPGKSDVYEHDNAWPCTRCVSCLAMNGPHWECKWRGWVQNRTSYLEHRVTVLGSRFFSMQLTPELCSNIAFFLIKGFQSIKGCGQVHHFGRKGKAVGGMHEWCELGIFKWSSLETSAGSLGPSATFLPRGPTTRCM